MDLISVNSSEKQFQTGKLQQRHAAYVGVEIISQ